jgi:hypothetical protein
VGGINVGPLGDGARGLDFVAFFDRGDFDLIIGFYS